ncbi:hypothetical protein DENSPDRAFT_232361 [Dentipellis sp. KUC8613]|nr:hypothetical protein DENSPDRAFT_232361 [Dentipellis sp. KUC8613]
MPHASDALRGAVYVLDVPYGTLLRKSRQKIVVAAQKSMDAATDRRMTSPALLPTQHPTSQEEPYTSWTSPTALLGDDMGPARLLVPGICEVLRSRYSCRPNWRPVGRLSDPCVFHLHVFTVSL